MHDQVFCPIHRGWFDVVGGTVVSSDFPATISACGHILPSTAEIRTVPATEPDSTPESKPDSEPVPAPAPTPVEPPAAPVEPEEVFWEID